MMEGEDEDADDEDEDEDACKSVIEMQKMESSPQNSLDPFR